MQECLRACASAFVAPVEYVWERGGRIRDKGEGVKRDVDRKERREEKK